MTLPLIKKIVKLCCTVSVFAIIAACQQRCPKCECSEVSTVVDARPERKTLRHHKKSFVKENDDEDDTKIN